MDSNQGNSFVPALGFKLLTPLYQTTVDLLCRDDLIKKKLVSLIKGDHLKILDVACGTGKFIRLLADAQNCCDIVGIDIDPEMVKTASRKCSSYGNIKIEHGDVTDLQFGNATFDIVVESLVFHHLSDRKKEQAIQQITRILKSDGIFFFVDWVKPKSFYSKLAFNIVKIFDGSENLKSHENNEVIKMIEQKMQMVGTQHFVQTSLGTISIAMFQPLAELKQL